MRFSIFFMKYKMEIKGLSSTIKWEKLPSYRKVILIIVFVLLISLEIALILKKLMIALLILGALIVLAIIYGIIDSSKKNQEKMIKEHYEKYAEDRMKVVLKLLHEFSIDKNDEDRLRMLIEQAKEAKVDSDPIIPLVRPMKLLGTIIVPIVVAIANRLAEETNINKLIVWGAQIVIIAISVFAILIAILPLVKELIFRDGKRYDDLIYDINQVILFYSGNASLERN